MTVHTIYVTHSKILIIEKRFCFHKINPKDSSPPPTPPFPQIHYLSILSSENNRIPRVKDQHAKTKCNKTSQKPSYWGWTKQPNNMKRITRAGEKVRDTNAPTTRTPTKTLSSLLPDVYLQCLFNTHVTKMEFSTLWRGYERDTGFTSPWGSISYLIHVFVWISSF